MESEDGMYVSADAGSFECPDGFELVTDNLECRGLSSIKWKKTENTVIGDGKSICVTGSAGARPGCFGNLKKSQKTISVMMMQCGNKDKTIENQFGICKKKDACPAFDRDLVVDCTEPKNAELCTFTTCCVDYNAGCEKPKEYQYYKQGKAIGRWVDNCSPYHCTCTLGGCKKTPTKKCKVDFAMPLFAANPMAPYFYLLDASTMAPGQIRKKTGMPKQMEHRPSCLAKQGGYARLVEARENCYGKTSATPTLKLEAVPGQNYEDDKSFTLASSKNEECLQKVGSSFKLGSCRKTRDNAVFTAESDGLPFGVSADRQMGGPFRLLDFRQKDKCVSSQFTLVPCSQAAYFYWWRA
jgi:hypothetical protein